MQSIQEQVASYCSPPTRSELIVLLSLSHANHKSPIAYYNVATTCATTFTLHKTSTITAKDGSFVYEETKNTNFDVLSTQLGVPHIETMLLTLFLRSPPKDLIHACYIQIALSYNRMFGLGRSIKDVALHNWHYRQNYDVKEWLKKYEERYHRPFFSPEIFAELYMKLLHYFWCDIQPWPLYKQFVKVFSADTRPFRFSGQCTAHRSVTIAERTEVSSRINIRVYRSTNRFKLETVEYTPEEFLDKEVTWEQINNQDCNYYVSLDYKTLDQLFSPFISYYTQITSASQTLFYESHYYLVEAPTLKIPKSEKKLEEYMAALVDFRLLIHYWNASTYSPNPDMLGDGPLAIEKLTPEQLRDELDVKRKIIKQLFE